MLIFAPNRRVTCILPFPLLPDQRHQDLQVQSLHLSTSQPVRAVPEDRQRLLPVPAGASGEPNKHTQAYKDDLI